MSRRLQDNRISAAILIAVAVVVTGDSARIAGAKFFPKATNGDASDSASYQVEIAQPPDNAMERGSVNVIRTSSYAEWGATSGSGCGTATNSLTTINRQMKPKTASPAVKKSVTK
jgi:hypothetical protein